ncbi:MAG: glucuronate isomerase [Actinomycetota bacterium]|jgi:glucuronate isomerase
MQMKTELNSRRLLPVEPEALAIAEQLYEQVAKLPIISPHGHVDPKLLLENKPFANPAELFIYHDHYVTRLLHAAGYSLNELGKSENPDPRRTWKILCSNWHLLAGTSSGYWLTHEFATLFGITETPSEQNADTLYDRIASNLLEPHMLPRALFKKFNIKFLATTDDPCDDLAVHKAIAEDDSFGGRIAPTFRPDAYLDPRNPAFVSNVTKLLAITKKPSATFSNYISALEERRAFFIEHGAISADHGVLEPFTTVLSEAKVSQFFDQAMAGQLSAEDARLFAGHMLCEMARMSSEDGLVMTIHAGVYRNHSTETFKKFGPDTGQDIPVRAEFVNNLHALLENYGLNPNLHVILFALDETTWGREIAPLAGFYPSVYVGAPWWFLDAPDSATRFREATTEIAGFYRGSGFIDDTRAFLSIPARHDMARRIDCAFLARLVIQGRITYEEAEKIAKDLVVAVPKKAFKL